MLKQYTTKADRETYQKATIKELTDETQPQNKKFQSVYDIFDRVLWEMDGATRQAVMTENPILQLEYSATGRVKSIAEFLEDFSQLDFNKRKFRLCREILRNGNVFQPRNITEDLQTLSQFETSNSFMSSAVSFFVSDNIGRVLKEAENEIFTPASGVTLEGKQNSNYSNEDKSKEEQVRSFQRTFRKIEWQMEKGDCSKAFIRGMQRGKRGEKTAIEVFRAFYTRLNQEFGELPSEEPMEQFSYTISREEMKRNVGETYRLHGEDIPKASQFLKSQIEQKIEK